VLAVGSRFAEHDFSRLKRQRNASEVNTFPVRFHVDLLEVGGKAEQSLRIRQHRARHVTEKRRVPKPHHPQHYWQVGLKGSSLEVFVHRMGTIQKLAHDPKAILQCKRNLYRKDPWFYKEEKKIVE